jgi:diaminopimelate epimerase
VAAAITGRAGRQSTIVMDGGTLLVEWTRTNDHVYLTGPAVTVFEGDINV